MNTLEFAITGLIIVLINFIYVIYKRNKRVDALVQTIIGYEMEMEYLENTIIRLTPKPKRKCGRPKGSKNKSKK